MLQQSLCEIMNELDTKKISSVELVQETLKNIEKYQPELNCFITISREHALAQAKQADETRAAGKATALTGVPIAHKDLFCTKGIRTTCASKMLDNFIAPYDATVVSRCNEAGLITVGKTNQDEFGMGSSNENSYYGPVKNPWDLARVPGGSSGGAAAAVAAGLVPFATGTDTGGSVRQPASLCGITGIKPTYGRVSRYGMIAFASSLDQAGIFARSAQDCALLLKVMAGFDEKDSTSASHPVPDYPSLLNKPISNLRIGLPKEYFSEKLDRRIADCIEKAIQVLTQQGAQIKEISLPNSALAVPAYYVIAPAECSSNLSRYDGVRFGYRCAQPKNLDDMYKRSRGEAFGKEVQRRIMIGTYTLSAGYYDAYYLKAQKIRSLIRNDFKKAFEDIDIIACPASPSTAFKIGEKVDDPISMYLSDIYTIALNLAGLPGMSVPAGLVDGLPVGMQLIGNYFAEDTLLNTAHAYQKATEWHSMLSPFIKERCI